MRVVFMGTPELAATVLEHLAREHEVVGVFTRPDAVRGRGKKLVASPVKETAVGLGIPVYTPSSMKDEESARQLRELEPDAVCVVAFGALLPRTVLDIPRYGCLNVHTSLLPRWRGAAPIERAILAQDEVTGVSIMRVEEGLDTGPYCAQVTVPVAGASVGELTAKLAAAGAEALVEALRQAEAGTIEWVEQGEDGLTYARKLEKGELDCEPADTVAAIDAKVRASSGSHPARLQVEGRRMSVERAVLPEAVSLPGGTDLEPGEAAVVAKRLVIGAADGIVELAQVKPDGKKSMEGRAFAAGLQGARGARMKWGRA